MSASELQQWLKSEYNIELKLASNRQIEALFIDIDKIIIDQRLKKELHRACLRIKNKQIANPINYLIDCLNTLLMQIKWQLHCRDIDHNCLKKLKRFTINPLGLLERSKVDISDDILAPAILHCINEYCFKTYNIWVRSEYYNGYYITRLAKAIDVDYKTAVNQLIKLVYDLRYDKPNKDIYPSTEMIIQLAKTTDWAGIRNRFYAGMTKLVKSTREGYNE